MYVKKFLTDIKDIKSKDTNTIITETTKGTIVGAGLGAGVGLVVGLARRRNIVFSIFIGSVIGGSISRFFLTNKN